MLGGSLYGIVVNVMDWDIAGSKFELQLCYYVLSLSPEKGINFLIPPPKLFFFYNDDFGIK